MSPARLSTGLIGEYNVANLLGVIGTLRALGMSLNDAVAACRDLSSVPGRMERVSEEGAPLAVVDYAHTPDALDKALAGLRAFADQRGGRLWCVFGCGGDRDPIKRPMMAAVAEVGRPSVSSGTRVPAAEALLAASGPATPSMAPLPNSSLCLLRRFSSA